MNSRIQLPNQNDPILQKAQAMEHRAQQQQQALISTAANFFSKILLENFLENCRLKDKTGINLFDLDERKSDYRSDEYARARLDARDFILLHFGQNLGEQLLPMIDPHPVEEDVPAAESDAEPA